MQTFAASPVLNQMVDGDVAYTPQSLTPRPLPATGRFRPFYAVRGYTVDTATGYLGGQFFVRGMDLFVSGGADYTPLGVRSSLLHAGENALHGVRCQAEAVFPRRDTAFPSSAPTATAREAACPLM